MREGFHKSANGDQFWYLHDKLHRVGAPAAITNDAEHWYFHGNRHREDGPAMVCTDGTLEWWVHGNLHKTDGPAVIYGGGGGAEWWVDDEYIHSRQRYQMLTEIPDEEFAMLILKYGGFEI